MAELCKHLIDPPLCALCNPRKRPQTPRQPRERRVKTIHGAGTQQTEEALGLGYVVVRTVGGMRGKRFPQLNAEARYVHIDGAPLLWAINLILERAPQVEVIRVAPGKERKLKSSHRRLCEERGVILISGYMNPGFTPQEGVIRSPHYRPQREFLLHLSGEQKRLFEELRTLDFHSAHITARYFCLGDEEYLPQHEVAVLFDFGDEERIVSLHVNAVLRYLDKSFKTGKASQRIAKALQAKVVRLRRLLEEAQKQEPTVGQPERRSMHRLVAERLGLEQLPEKLPWSRLEDFVAVVTASRTDRYSQFRDSHPDEYRVLVLRYGLEDNTYRTLHEVARVMGGTYHGVWLMEQGAFRLLGIQTD